MPADTKESLQEITDDITVTQWVAKDTYFIMKTEIEMTVEFSAEILSSLMDLPHGTLSALGEEGQMDTDITYTCLVYNHNESISVEVPPEAIEATE